MIISSRSSSARLDATLRPWFVLRILDIDEDVLLTWRRMIERSRVQARPTSLSRLLSKAGFSFKNADGRGMRTRGRP